MKKCLFGLSVFGVALVSSLPFVLDYAEDAAMEYKEKYAIPAEKVNDTPGSADWATVTSKECSSDTPDVSFPVSSIRSCYNALATEYSCSKVICEQDGAVVAAFGNKTDMNGERYVVSFKID